MSYGGYSGPRHGGGRRGRGGGGGENKPAYILYNLLTRL